MIIIEGAETGCSLLSILQSNC